MGHKHIIEALVNIANDIDDQGIDDVANTMTVLAQNMLSNDWDDEETYNPDDYAGDLGFQGADDAEHQKNVLDVDDYWNGIREDMQSPPVKAPQINDRSEMEKFVHRLNQTNDQQPLDINTGNNSINTSPDDGIFDEERDYRTPVSSKRIKKIVKL